MMTGLLSSLLLAAVVAGAATTAIAQTAASPVLAEIQARGHLRCGVAGDTPGFSTRDANDNWTGLDVDFCRALAAAIFNDPGKVRYTELGAAESFAALASNSVDIHSRAIWTMSHDARDDVGFVGALFHDGQAFMVHRNAGIETALDLGEARVCVETGMSELNVEDYFGANGMRYEPVPFGSRDEAWKAYEDGLCRAIASGASALAGNRTTLPVPEDHVILPEIIAKEPLGPAVPQADPGWFNIARWTYFALLNAEELGVTQANVDEMLGSESPEIKRLLGIEGEFGTPLGLSNDWAFRIIKNVGNYAEIYERHLGMNTPVQLERGLNALWRDGGIQYAPPIR